MLLYRITKEKWAGNLNASGVAARWNPNGINMCYTAESKPLACLELLAHLNTTETSKSYKITCIEVDNNISCEEIDLEELPSNWQDFFNMPITQSIGKRWAQSLDSCLLKVPSALMDECHNYLINPLHKDFSRFHISKIEDFLFDQRFIKKL